MTTSSRLFAVAFAFGLVALEAPAAFAQPQPSAADLESARELFKEAKALREKGDLRTALDKFKAAHAYGQTPVTALELGRTHMQLNELVEAREVLLSVGRMKVASDETEKSAGARTEAADLAEEIRPRIPTLVVKVTGTTEAPTITVDGASLPVVSASATRKVNPGSHAVVVRAGTREEKRTVDTKEGETQELVIALATTGAAAPAVVSAAKPATADAPPHGRAISPVTWIGLGVGVVGIGVGAVTGALALGKAGKVKDACDGTRCPTSAKDDVDSGRTVATISTVSFIVGAVGLATAAVGWFVLSKNDAAPAGSSGASSPPRVAKGVTLSVGPGGVDGTF